MKKLVFAIFGLAFIAVSTLNAQTVEKTHPISGESKRGNITDLYYDTETGNIELRYMYSHTVNGEAMYESYKYDKDFNQIGNTKETGPTTDLAAKSQHNNYRGESYTVTGVKLGYNLSLKMELALTKTETKYTYNWFINDYVPVTRDVSKTTLVPEDAAGYVGILGVEDLHSGGGLIVAALRDKMFGKDLDKYMQYKKYRFMKMDGDLNKVKETKLDLDQMHKVVFSKPIYLETGIAAMPELSGVALILAPVYLKNEDCKPADEWTFLFVDKDGNITRNAGFKVESTDWDISDIVYNEASDELYVYGPANKNTDREGAARYFLNLTMQVTTTTTIGNEKKYTLMQIMKVRGSDVVYCTCESLDEMADKTYNLKGQVKNRVYKARKFEVMGVNYMSNGDFMIYGTNYGYRDSLGVISNYEEAVTIHFDKDGGVRKIYAIKPNEHNYQSVPMTNTIVNDLSGKYMYWILEENAGVKPSLKLEGAVNASSGGFSYSGSFVWKYKYMLYPRIIRVDLENATMTEIIPGDKKYFLDNRFPFFQTPEGDIIFFGADFNGKNIWFSRLALD